jgi:hypothetical protein
MLIDDHAEAGGGWGAIKLAEVVVVIDSENAWHLLGGGGVDLRDTAAGDGGRGGPRVDEIREAVVGRVHGATCRLDGPVDARCGDANELRLFDLLLHGNPP